MQPIDSFDLRLFDLNLLVAFDALMRERSVTRAAARMRLGQPAMSHALATLRVLLRDELLVRVGHAMQPTARALAVHERVVEGLTALQGAVRPTEGFDPAREERTFRIGFSSDVELTLMPRLSALLAEEAPRVRIATRLLAACDVGPLFDAGGLDLAVGCFEAGAARFRARKLYDQALCCLWNPALLTVELPLTRERYVSEAHALMTLDDNLRGCLDRALAAAGETLNVVAASSQFLAVLAIAAAAPVFATLPSDVARLHARRFGLASTEPPLDLVLPPISLVQSVRSRHDPAVAWLGDIVARLLRRTVDGADDPWPAGRDFGPEGGIPCEAASSGAGRLRTG